jgi:coenzyme F420-dependent glucose-6-phosphate dehydrogenase
MKSIENTVIGKEDCIKSIEEYFKAGFTRVYVDSARPHELEFIRLFSREVLPYLGNN